jgi:hypothetical protein
MRDHVVITGTGRCGTTFLVELLTRLGLETGFDGDDIKTGKYPIARAGLEYDVRNADAPFIIKSPGFCHFAEEAFYREDITIRHIFVPMRDLNAAAESRRFVHSHNFKKLSGLRQMLYRIKPWVFPGGLWRTNSSDPGCQEEALLNQVYKLMLAVSNTSVPMTFMRYPRIVKDCPYLFEKLQPILNDIPYETFSETFKMTVCPELIHSFNSQDH